MRFLNPIYLITCTNRINEVGDLISDESGRKILAHIESIKQSEFYKAQSVGFKPEHVFKVRSFEFKDEEKLRYRGKLYRILRVYTKGDGITELVCIGDVNNAITT